MRRFTQLLQVNVPSGDDGLTFAEVLQSVPFDPASILAYLLVAGFVGGVIWFGTRGSQPPASPQAKGPGSRRRPPAPPAPPAG